MRRKNSRIALHIGFLLSVVWAGGWLVIALIVLSIGGSYPATISMRLLMASPALVMAASGASAAVLIMGRIRLAEARDRRIAPSVPPYEERRGFEPIIPPREKGGS